MKTLITLIVMMVLVGCGANDPTVNGKDKAAVASETDSQTLTKTGDYYTVTGYVSPINISVNSKTYKDSEDFYTQELIKLKAEAKTEFPGYTLTFDAAVGLNNFKSGMSVFLVATSESGVASQSIVDSTGKFLFMLDGTVDVKAEYTLRATKRIGMKLTKGEETIAWCYNFYAEKNIALENNPLILREFRTTITQYQCSEQGDGMSLPNPDDYQSIEDSWAAKAKAEADRTAKVNNPTPTSTPDAEDTDVVTPTPTTSSN